MTKTLIGAAVVVALGMALKCPAQNAAPAAAPPPPPAAGPPPPAALPHNGRHEHERMHEHDDMHMPSPDELFKQMDTNHDGVLSLEEFRKGMEMHREHMRKEHMHMHHPDDRMGADDKAHTDKSPPTSPPEDK